MNTTYIFIEINKLFDRSVYVLPSRATALRPYGYSFWRIEMAVPHPNNIKTNLKWKATDKILAINIYVCMYLSIYRWKYVLRKYETWTIWHSVCKLVCKYVRTCVLYGCSIHISLCKYVCLYVRWFPFSFYDARFQNMLKHCWAEIYDSLLYTKIENSNRIYF